MVNIVHSETLDSFNYMLYPEPNVNTQNYIRNQIDRYSETLTEVGRNFMKTSKEVYDRFNDINAVRLAKSALRSAHGLFHDDSIQALNTLERLRMAQPVMQRWIMAEPTIREIYHQQRCDGFSDSYVDLHPNQIAKGHYDYRVVTDGIILESDNEDDPWTSITYSEELETGDRELDIIEKADILSTWDITKMFIGEGEDPTNMFGGKLV